jgi:hypothetical protein
MISRDFILLYLSRDKWFQPSRTYNQTTVQDDNGNEITVAKSYYHDYGNWGIMIRVSEHGTYLQNWAKRLKDPSENLQNLSIVFCDKPTQSNTETKPRITKGGKSKEYTYFATEQYEYRIDKLNESDFNKIINSLKNLNGDVFIDPLRKTPSKRATFHVFTPSDENGNKIPQSTNCNSRQIMVANNPDKYVDKNGNVVEGIQLRKGKIVLTESQLIRLISEEMQNVLDIQRLKQKQLDLILKSNPMLDDYHTGIRTIDDIQQALNSGYINVYSSKPIKIGTFVTPSKHCAKDYAGSNHIYSKRVNIYDVAWIDTYEGQYASTK